jgi:hypothetical protein
MSASWLSVMSGQLPGRRPIKKPGGIRQAKSTQTGFVDFGNLAILSERTPDLRPMALRPRLSDGFAFIVFLSGYGSIKTVFGSLQTIDNRRGEPSE